MTGIYKIKDPGLAENIEPGELEWLRTISPITGAVASQVAQKDFQGRRFAYWGHITRQNTILMMDALRQAGVKIVLGACNVDSTDDTAAAYAVSRGISVYGWSGMTNAEYDENMAAVRSFEADFLCDMGGELCLAYRDKVPPVKGALEATMSGLHKLRNAQLPFPVFDWNSIPIKDLHNRFHVGDTVWPAFNQLTGMSLYGRRVLVVGCGPVGKGIAERARVLGALVLVTDLDPVHLLEMQHLGCEPVSLEEGISRCRIIVTATGAEGVIREEHFRQVRPGTILFNAGHSNREMDINWLYQQPHRRLKQHIERFDLGGTFLFLLAQGSLLNLAGGAGPFGVDQFDHYTAVMLLGIAWMMEGIPENIQPGLQPYPKSLEREIADLSMRIKNAE